MTRIFVKNDALVFFDVDIPQLSVWSAHLFGIPKISEVVKIKDNPLRSLHGQPYNFLVEDGKTHYFVTNGYEGRLKTISVTTPCIVVCAYTVDEQENIGSSGVYHAYSLPPERGFHKRLCRLIDTVRSKSNKPVIVKAAGSDWKEEYLQKRIREYLTKVLAVKGIKIEPEYFLFGGGAYRITEFDPQYGQLITYFSNSEQKTIL